ncbi:MAG TPA: acyl dehydratase [Gemmatimonadetes bacterium]|mgnify:CR=1 FL=1|nr:acyl dehydratase [Gemmatimonadota bacterium]
MTGSRSPLITKEALRSLQQRVGKEVKIATPGHISEINEDAIRHWAHGIGDRNPLWFDPERALATRFQGRTAPPTLILGFSKLATGYAGGMPGIHALYTGSDYTWMRYPRLGDQLTASVVLDDLVERNGKYAGRSFDQIARVTMKDQDGSVVAEGTSTVRRTERDTARERGKHRAMVPHTYTREELEEIWQDVDNEIRTGDRTLSESDLQPGVEIPVTVKGPLTITDNVTFAMAWGGAFMRSHGFARDYYLKHPGAFVTNELGVPDLSERVHWDADFAQEVGIAAPYDYGGQRYAWMGHLVTNWMGDNGFLRRLKVEFRRFNLIGDTTWCRGKVAEVRQESEHVAVDLEIWAHDQRDEVTTRGEATVWLYR